MTRLKDRVALVTGAHPLQALMSLHAVYGEMKRLQRELSNQ
jgi:hypothetical protein